MGKRRRDIPEASDDLRRLTSERDAAVAAERKAREELTQAQGQLTQAARLAALGQLVVGVAHEINNPLAFVINNTAVLQRDTRALAEILRLYHDACAAEPTRQAELLEEIRAREERIDIQYTLGALEPLITRSRDGLRRIQRIVQDLRSFARVEEGGPREVSDLAAGLDSTLNILRVQARDRRVELVTEIAALPPVVCSASKIQQVLLNLVSNALDACRENDRVIVRALASDHELRIEVEDSGPGIDPAIRDRIFEPFVTTKPPGQGTGLGLSISLGIIREHGGRIEVASEAGVKTVFTVCLPLRGAVTLPR